MSEPYRLVLVDDEDEIRGRIASRITGDSGFVIVGTAGNGYDALDLVERLSPHVLLTDIKMPYIDGIELARIVRREHPAVRIGFITGYDEFDYARQAVSLGVRSYLTKPLSKDDIETFLLQLRKELDDEFLENYNRDQIRRRYETSLPLIIENFMISCMTHGADGNGADIEQLRQCGVSLDDAAYLVAFVVPYRDAGQWGMVEFEQLKLSIRQRLADLLRLDELEHYGSMLHDGLVFVIKERGSDFDRRVDAAFNRMAMTTGQFLSVPIHIGVSTMHRGFQDLSLAWEEAAAALSLGRMGGSGVVSYAGQTGRTQTGQTGKLLAEGELAAIEYAMKFGTEAQLREALDRCSRTMGERYPHAKRDNTGDGLPAQTVRPDQPILALVNMVAMHAASLGLDIRELSGTSILEHMTTIQTLDQLFSWVVSMAGKLREKSMAVRATNAERMLEAATAYIREHYTDPDLTMETLCDELGISPSYLGQLYRKCRDTTFVRHLTTVRMDRARELLVKTGDRIVEIAGQCGYRDVYYFSHTFKKATGVSPKKYREDNA